MNPSTGPQHHSVNMQAQSPVNLPCADLLDEGRREDYNEICVPLYKATITSNWEGANNILLKRPELVRYSITESDETILHIAVSAIKNTARKNTRVEFFVKNLVSLMQKEDLELKNSNCETALYLAIASGNVKMVEVMVEKNKAVLDIPDSRGMMPLYTAALHGSGSMVRYMYEKSDKMNDDIIWTDESRGSVLLACVESELFYVGLRILTDRPELAINKSILSVLARKPIACEAIKSPFIKRIINTFLAIFHLDVGLAEKERPAIQLLRIVWKSILKLPKAEVDDILSGSDEPIKYENGTTSNVGEPTNATRKYSFGVLFVAAEMGNTAFVIELIREYPGLAWKVNDNNQSIFHLAVLHRHGSLFKLIYGVGMFKDSIVTLEDKNGNNMLHLVGTVGTRAKNNLTRKKPYLQMRREFFWLKKVGALLPLSLHEKKNAAGLNPYELFSDNHKDLASKDGKWLKGTAVQLMVVATLVAAITFSATITFAGGYNQETGNPVFLEKPSFVLFLLFNVLSFTNAIVSIVWVLPILFSDYNQINFVRTLPLLFTVVQMSLQFSILSLLLAFCSNFFMLYENNSKMKPTVVTVLILFIFGQSLCLYKIFFHGLSLFPSRSLSWLIMLLEN